MHATSTTRAPEGSELRSEPARAIDPPRVRKPAIKAWAVVGAVFLAFQAYVYVRWISGPYFKRVPTGPSHVPGYMHVFTDVWIPGGIVAMLGVLYWFVVRPWRRDGEPSTDGLLCLAWLTVLWQDPLVDYVSRQFTWSSVVPNMGSWVADVPGWISPVHPGATVVEPLPFNGPLYVYALFTQGLLCCWVMRRFHRRFPNVGTLGLMGIGWLFTAVFDLVMEVSWSVMGFYAYGGSIKSLSVFPGHYFQWPLYEAFFWGMSWSAWASLRYFKNDKGETLVERGITEMNVSKRKRTVYRFLAIVAAGNIFYLSYIVVFNFMGLQGEAWPKSVQDRSYLTNLMCGPGSVPPQACTGPSLPIPTQGSLYFNNKGQLVVPKGALPANTDQYSQVVR